MAFACNPWTPAGHASRLQREQSPPEFAVPREGLPLRRKALGQVLCQPLGGLGAQRGFSR